MLPHSPEYYYYKTDTLTIQLPQWPGFCDTQKDLVSDSRKQLPHLEKITKNLEITNNLLRSYLKCINHLIITPST